MNLEKWRKALEGKAFPLRAFENTKTVTVMHVEDALAILERACAEMLELAAVNLDAKAEGYTKEIGEWHKLDRQGLAHVDTFNTLCHMRGEVTRAASLLRALAAKEPKP